MDRVTVVKHPIVDASLTILRESSTTSELFRYHSQIVARAVLFEATREIPSEPRAIVTPLASHQGRVISAPIVFVPVLRAGLSLLGPALELIPNARVGMIGLERDEATARAHQYYAKFPSITADTFTLILDPMLATGGSAADTLKALRQRGAAQVTLVSCVAAPEGIAHLQAEDRQIRIVTAAIDQSLNEKKYIVPGLGDYGDRYFGTI